ncbi:MULTISPECIES: toll/interleukin-1 receptor domain-containing protein [unclassified Bacillus (in: firmicutes)]
MRKITIETDNNSYQLQESGNQPWHEYDGISIDFILNLKHIPEKEYLLKVSSLCKQFDWVNVEDDSFIFDLEKIKRNFKVFEECKWMKSYISLKPNYEPALDDSKFIVSFSATKKEIEVNSPKKIFLSHKGADKPLVREYFQLLKELGFDPWLDEDAMVAGTKLNRGIYEGFKESCAAVFFVTSAFKDEDYLEDEVDYAIDEQREKGDKFAIITLAIKDHDGYTGEIPSLLKKYVYKEPTSQLEAFREIIRGLPLETGKKIWKK